MNRRTFLKTVGVTVAIITSPAIAKQKPQWIRISEKQPDEGQKIIVLHRFEPDMICIYEELSNEASLWAGTVTLKRTDVKRPHIRIRIYHEHHHSEHLKYAKRSFAENIEEYSKLETCFKNAQKYDVPLNNIPWKKTNDNNLMYVQWGIGMKNPNCYWMVAPDKLPNTLPNMPKLIL